MDDMTEVMDPVQWHEDPRRQQWWENVLGVDTRMRECGTADFIEQQQDVPVGDDEMFPPTPSRPTGSAAA